MDTPINRLDFATVYVIDDEQLILDETVTLLIGSGLRVHGFLTVPAFQEQFDPARAGCLVLDLNLPEVSGMELQAWLNAKQINLPIIFITGNGDVPRAVEAMQMGASDFLLKPYKPKFLIDRVHALLAESVHQHAADEEHADIRANLATLTQREQLVLQHIRNGATNRRIGEIESISVRTVESHRATIMRKMKTRSVAQLLEMVLSCDAKDQSH